MIRSVLTGLALVATLSSCSKGGEQPAGPGEVQKITLGMTTWVGFGTVHLARDLGYFKDAGLDVTITTIEEPSVYMAALASGRLDGAATTLDNLMKYRSDENCFKGVIGLDDSFGGDGIVTTPNITSLKQLRGQQIGLNEGSISEFWFNMVAAKEGMTRSDFRITNLTAADAATAFMAGRIPAAVTWEPSLTMVKESKRGHVLVDSSSTPGAIVDVVALRCQLIDQNPKAVQAFVDGVLRAVDYVKTNPEDANARMAKSLGGYLSTPAAFAEAAKTSRFFDRPRAQAFFADPQGGEAARILAEGNKLWGAAGAMKMQVNYDTIVDPRFVAGK